MTGRAALVAIEPTTRAVMAQIAALGWVRRAPLAARGQFHLLPRGAIVHRLMGDFLADWVRRHLKAEEIRSPIAYDWEDPGIQAQSGRFAERMFVMASDGRSIAFRPGGDYGALSLLKARPPSTAHLPLTVFELCASLRHGRRGELNGLSKARYFTLLDLHTLALDDMSAWDAYRAIVRAQDALGAHFGFDARIIWQIPAAERSVWQPWLAAAAEGLHAAVTFEEIAEHHNYWTIQHRFQTEDGVGFSDGQYDTANPAAYGLAVAKGGVAGKAGGEADPPLVLLHGSFDSVERWIVNLVGRALAGRSTFPLWLYPAHLRLVTTDGRVLADARVLQDAAARRGVRIEIDARDKPLGARIAAGRRDWVPHTLVYGPAEAAGDGPTRAFAPAGDARTIALGRLLDEVADAIAPYPRVTYTAEAAIGQPTLA